MATFAGGRNGPQPGAASFFGNCDGVAGDGTAPGRESPFFPRQLACWGPRTRVDLIPEPPPSERAKLPGISALRASHATAVSTFYASTADELG